MPVFSVHREAKSVVTVFVEAPNAAIAVEFAKGVMDNKSYSAEEKIEWSAWPCRDAAPVEQYDDRIR